MNKEVIDTMMFFIALLTAFGGVTYVIMKLMIQPIKEELDCLKTAVSELKTEKELEEMIDYRIQKHVLECTRGE